MTDELCAVPYGPLHRHRRHVVLLRGVGPDHQYAVGVLQVPNGVGGGLVPQALLQGLGHLRPGVGGVIDVVCAHDRAGELLQQVVLLVGAAIGCDGRELVALVLAELLCDGKRSPPPKEASSRTPLRLIRGVLSLVRLLTNSKPNLPLKQAWPWLASASRAGIARITLPRLLTSSFSWHPTGQ